MKISFLIAVAVLTILVTMIAAGMTLWAQKRLASWAQFSSFPISQITTSTQTTSPSSKHSPTWIIYRNRQYGFTFQYPPICIIYEQDRTPILTLEHSDYLFLNSKNKAVIRSITIYEESRNIFDNISTLAKEGKEPGGLLSNPQSNFRQTEIDGHNTFIIEGGSEGIAYTTVYIAQEAKE